MLFSYSLLNVWFFPDTIVPGFHILSKYCNHYKILLNFYLEFSRVCWFLFLRLIKIEGLGKRGWGGYFEGFLGVSFWDFVLVWLVDVVQGNKIKIM